MFYSGLLLLLLAPSQAAAAEEPAPPPEIAAQQSAAQQKADKKPGKKKRAAQTPQDDDDDEAAEDDEFQKQQFLQNSAFLALFREEALLYSGRGYRDREFKYRLFAPAAASPQDERPLLVWLHGAGEAGDDSNWHMRHLNELVFLPPWDPNRYPFFLLALQCPADNPAWTTDSPDADDMANVVAAAIDKVVRERPVDVDRISLSGVSAGGSGCWALAARRPELFSGVAPLASAGIEESQAKLLANVPVWAFHSSADSRTPADSVRRTVAALANAGGRVHLTETKSSQHDCWHAAFNDYDLLSWLLAQKRGDSASPAPGTTSPQTKLHLAWRYLRTEWTPAQLFGQLGIPLLLIVAFWSAARKRRLRRESAGTR